MYKKRRTGKEKSRDNMSAVNVPIKLIKNCISRGVVQEVHVID